jgi:uncharacterized protein
MNKKEISNKYKAAPYARIPDGKRLMLISINRTIVIEDAEYSLSDRVRYSWVIAPTRANRADYVLAVAYGVIVGVFGIEGDWMPATKRNFPEIPGRYGNWERQKGRWGFRARQAPPSVEEIYLHKRVPDELRNHGAPIRYLGF